MKSLLSRFSWFHVLLSVFLILMVILPISRAGSAKMAEPEVRETQTTDDQPSKTIDNEDIHPEEATISSSLPNSLEDTSTPTGPIGDECAEDVEEPQRENILYYVDDSGYRYDCEIEYQDYLWEKCKEYGIDAYYELLLAQIYHESKFNPTVVSRTNDYGLMQINSCNHDWLKQTLGITDFLDPYDSIDAGVYIMSGYLLKYNDIHMALMCYNMGEGGAKKSGQTSSTYSRGVVADMDKLQLLEE